MTTRLDSAAPLPTVDLSHTQYRVTPSPARPFRAFLGSGANAVIEGAEAAARRLPGGPEIVAAVRSEGERPLGPGAASGGAGARGSAGASYGANAAGGVGPAGSAAPSGTGGIEAALAKHTEDAMYYLQLQEHVQSQTRNFQAVSNVMKAEHDSVKNAIGNLR